MRLSSLTLFAGTAQTARGPLAKSLYFKSMSDYLTNIGNELGKGSITFKYVDNAIHIPLPNEFGILEIRLLGDNDDSIQILNADFHSHGTVEAAEYETTREKGIRKMVENMFNGKLLLIEETEEGKEPRRLVQCSMEDYLKYLPTNTTYRVFNEI